jgi:histidyl-tRNA synthetase
LTSSNTQPARGTRDFLPGDVRRREHVIGVVRDVYERYGYEPLETPAFENIETLLGKYGEEGNKLIFKILRRGEHEASGEADLALRYDLTVPLARVVAQYQNELPKFFKRYQIQPVWRADRPARGRFREFYQCDIDAIGSTSPVVEAELLAAVSDVLAGLGFEDYSLRLNHRLVLSGLLNAAGVMSSQHGDALIALDKLDKIGVDGVAKEFEARGFERALARKVLEQFDVPAAECPDDTIRRLGALLGPDDSAVGNLRDIVSLMEGTPAAKRLRIDLSLARGLSYYTGAIMEISVAQLAGSLGGGGRYDQLVGMFSGRHVPACGFSLGLERIIVVMTERHMFPAAVAAVGVDVMVALFSHATRGDALVLASELRGAKLRIDVYPEPDKLDKQFKYASRRQVPFVAVVGDEEIATGQVSLKDLRTGKREVVPRAEVGPLIVSRLGNLGHAPDDDRRPEPGL